MAIVVNQAAAASGVLMIASPLASLGAKTATTKGMPDATQRPPTLARNIRTDVSVVISSVSRVSDEFSAP